VDFLMMVVGGVSLTMVLRGKDVVLVVTAFAMVVRKVGVAPVV